MKRSLLVVSLASLSSCSSAEAPPDAAVDAAPDAAPDATPDAQLVNCADPAISALLGDWSLTMTTEARCTAEGTMGRFYWVTCDPTGIVINGDWPTDRVNVERAITSPSADHVKLEVVIYDDVDPSIFAYSEAVTMHQVAEQGGVPVFDGTGVLVVGYGDQACQEGIQVQALHDTLPAGP